MNGAGCLAAGALAVLVRSFLLGGRPLLLRDGGRTFALGGRAPVLVGREPLFVGRVPVLVGLVALLGGGGGGGLVPLLVGLVEALPLLGGRPLELRLGGRPFDARLCGREPFCEFGLSCMLGIERFALSN